MTRMSEGWLAVLLSLGVTLGTWARVGACDEPRPLSGTTGTFSIAAADPDSGVCGAAVASKYPAVGKVVPYARAGVGAFCTQHWHHPPWGQRALDLLQAGKAPEEVLAELLEGDPQRGFRQLGIIDVRGRAAHRNCHDAKPDGRWWGAMSGRFYTCQGNTLTGPEVIIDMAKAYEQTTGSLADRLMAALVAGDRAGGDHRGRLAAGVRVARPGVEGYWLELHVDHHDDAVTELARKYAQLDHPAKGKGPKPVTVHGDCPNFRPETARKMSQSPARERLPKPSP
mgnify:CR=1 FL=1